MKKIFSVLVLLLMAATGLVAQTTYNVTVKDGTEDSENWSAVPNPATAGQTVTITYSGTNTVKSIKAVKKSPVRTVGQIIGSDGKNYDAGSLLPTGVTAVAMIAYVNGTSGLAIQLNRIPESKTWEEAKTYAENLNTSTPIAGGTWRLPTKEDWQNMFLGCAVSGDATSASDAMHPIEGFKEKIKTTGTAWQSGRYWSSSTPGDSKAWYVHSYLDDRDADANFSQGDTSSKNYVLGCLAF